MSFFQPPPPLPALPEPVETPEWRSPPDNVLPVAVPLLLALARTDELALWAHGFVAYPNGFSFALELLRRLEPEDPMADPFLPRRRGAVAADVFRFGVQFADGAKATNLAQPWELPPGEQLQPPVLSPHGGSGSLRRRAMRYWVWPLPPAGPWAFVCAWAAQGIAETRVDTEAGPILDAAREAVVLWPDGGPGPGGWSGGYRIG